MFILCEDEAPGQFPIVWLSLAQTRELYNDWNGRGLDALLNERPEIYWNAYEYGDPTERDPEKRIMDVLK
jgi:hypothetical protein